MFRCPRCGKEFPSKYYFVSDNVCNDCFGRMSDPERNEVLKETATLAVEEPAPRWVDGHKLVCPICGHDRFGRRKTLMNTFGLTFLGLEWANKEAASFICDSCGYVMWFMREDATA